MPTPVHIVSAEQLRMKQAVMACLERHPFAEPWWLRGRHLQTIWAPLFRVPPVTPPVRTERVDTPDDDFFVIHVQEGNPAKPTAVLLHGLEGSQQSKYILGLHKAFGELGWPVVTMEFRSCSGEMNRARRIYHMGETSDLDLLIRRLIDANPSIEIFATGFSLGGNVLGKWLGEQGDSAPKQVKAAAIVSAPYDCVISGPYLDRPAARLYRHKFMRSLIPKVIEKERQFPGLIDVERIRRCTTFTEFDTRVTSVLHGFRDAADYWAKTSCGQFLPGVRRPLMLLSAADDPFNPETTLPRAHAERSPWLHPQFTETGGHVGFIYGPNPWQARYWAEEQTVRFFQAYHSGSGSPT